MLRRAIPGFLFIVLSFTANAEASPKKGDFALGAGLNEGFGLAWAPFNSFFFDAYPAPMIKGSYFITDGFELGIGFSYHYLGTKAGSSTCICSSDILDSRIMGDINARYNLLISKSWSWFVAAGPTAGVTLHFYHELGSTSPAPLLGSPTVGFRTQTGFGAMVHEKVRISFGLEYQMGWTYFNLPVNSGPLSSGQGSVLLTVDYIL